jgi:Mg2+ and Co2+ transporter CorA
MEEEMDALDAIGLTLEDALNVMETEKKRVRSRRDGKVCICGHSMKQHTDNGRGELNCQPAKMFCKCRHAQVALVVPDTRMFMFRTTGPSAMHALVKGIAATMKKGKTVEWVVDLVCTVCGSEDGRKVVPHAATETKTLVANDDGAWNILICDECRLSLRGMH